tara:strand:- start:359 stop:571 length:213 start_codon:yes stop_codon:yes gene_type:complete
MIDIDYLERDRIRRGVTQREFAAMLDLSESGYAGLLRRRSAHANTINRIVGRLMLDRNKLVPEPNIDELD